jgi:hypothetical protein
MDSDDELMMEVLQDDEAEAAAHLLCWNMGFAFLLQLWQQMENAIPRRGGSVPGKAPNKNRSRDALLLYSDYFADNAINTPKEFCRRFRMNKELFMKIVHDVREYDNYFKYKKDCTGKWGVHVRSEMHGRPTVHCIWSSAGYFSGLSTNG